MDLVGGLTAARLAIDIAKDLRSIDRSVDEATFKLKLADLTSALADAQLALSEAKTRVAELESELSTALNGEICPKCRTGRLNLVKSSKMAMGGLGNFGVEERHFECSSEACGFATKVVHDPQGLVPKFIAKK